MISNGAIASVSDLGSYKYRITGVGQGNTTIRFRTSDGKFETSWDVYKRQAHAVLRNASPHAHLIENGHITKNGGWWEGKHMLENTMTHRQPQIDKAIDKLIDEVFDF